jgi:hypothetical protein
MTRSQAECWCDRALEVHASIGEEAYQRKNILHDVLRTDPLISLKFQGLCADTNS